MDHSQLIAIGHSLGFIAFTKVGLCQGFTCMRTQATCNGAVAEFNARMVLLETYKDNPIGLKIAIDAAREKVRQGVKPTDDEHNLIDIYVFFYGLSLYHAPEKWSQLFQDRDFHQDSIEVMSNLTQVEPGSSIMFSDSSYGLIRMSNNPNTMQDSELEALLQNKPAYVLFGEEVLFIDRNPKDKKLQKTTLQTDDFAKLAALFPSQESALDTRLEATEDNLKLITALTGHPESHITCLHKDTNIYTRAELIEYFSDLSHALAGQPNVSIHVSPPAHTTNLRVVGNNKIEFLDTNGATLEDREIRARIYEGREGIEQLVDTIMTKYFKGSDTGLAIATEVIALSTEKKNNALLDLSNKLKQIADKGLEEPFINRRSKDGRSRLALAINNRNLPLVNTLLDKGADVSMRDSNNITPLAQAAFIGKLSIVKRLLEAGAEFLNEAEGTSPLIFAANAGHLSIVEEFLNYNNQSILKNKNDLLLGLALQQAAKAGHYSVMMVLLDAHKSAHPETHAAIVADAAGAAFYNGHFRIFRTLKNQVVSTKVAAYLGGSEETPLCLRLMEACKRDPPTGLDALENFLSEEINQVDINEPDSAGQPPLIYAIINNQPAIVDLLIKAKPNMQVLDNFGFTPLIWAVKLGHTNMVDALLKAGATELTNNNNLSALDWAALSGNSDILNLLLDSACRTEEGKKSISKFFNEAILSNKIHLVSELLAYKNKEIDFNIVSEFGDIGLLMAVYTKSPQMIEKLLEHNPSILEADDKNLSVVYLWVANNDNPAVLKKLFDYICIKISRPDLVQTELMRAIRENNLGIVQKLLSYDGSRAYINAVNDEKQSALMLAVSLGFTDIAVALVAAGVNIKLKDNNGHTAIDLAIESHNDPLIRAIYESANFDDKKTILAQLIQEQHKRCIQKLEDLGEQCSVGAEDSAMIGFINLKKIGFNAIKASSKVTYDDYLLLIEMEKNVVDLQKELMPVTDAVKGLMIKIQSIGSKGGLDFFNSIPCKLEVKRIKKVITNMPVEQRRQIATLNETAIAPLLGGKQFCEAIRTFLLKKLGSDNTSPTNKTVTIHTAVGDAEASAIQPKR